VHRQRYAQRVSRTSDQAVCLRHWDWSETSQTLALFTRTHGILRALAKGSRRPGTPYSGGVELLTRGEATFILKTETDLHLLVEWDLQETFPALRTHLEVYYAGAYAAECVQRMVHDHDAHPELFDALLVLLRALSDPGSLPLALLRFQHQLLLWCGFRPGLDAAPRGAPEGPKAGLVLAFSPELGELVEGVGAGRPRGSTDLWPVRAATIEAIRAVAHPDSMQVSFSGVQGRDIDRANAFLASYICHLLGSAPSSLRTLLPNLVVPGAGSWRVG